MKKQWIMALAGIALLAALLVAPDEALAAAQRGVTLFAGTLLPSLFPFLVASQLIAQSGALSWTGQALGRVTPRLFGLPGNSALALCLSIASGYPEMCIRDRSRCVDASRRRSGQGAPCTGKRQGT